MPRISLTISVILCTWLSAFSQARITQAVKTATAPHIDGLLNDSVWQQAPIATDFITYSPVFGSSSGFRTTVKVLYDDRAIYIGAFMYDDPALVRREFTARDSSRRADADYFSVFIDTYNDKLNAFQFQVTSRNVQTDARVSPNIKPDFGVYGDLSWDAVWESHVAFTREGWGVEMKIPLFSIRFSKKNVEQWGLQFLRFNRRLNETSFWNPVDPNVNGFVNQFGIMTGLRNLVPPLRLSFSPYLSGGYRGTPQPGGYRQEWLRSGGMDVKYGLSESFTLDATLIPDFGQVISDNVVNNVSPYEVQFRENRPFFTEGTELFNKAGIFYSRRVGQTPRRYYSVENMARDGSLGNYEVIRNPSVTPLYNAVKLSGRTVGNLGIGVFNAVTEPVHASLSNRATGADSVILTESLANYNIVVLDQALKNRSYITFTNTNVTRQGHARDANVTAVDLELYDRHNRFGVTVRPRYSKIFGNKSYEGFSNKIRAGKVSGKLQYSVGSAVVSDKYDPNDLGYLLSPNDITNTLDASYNIYTPSASFLNQRYGVTLLQSYLYKPFEYKNTEIDAYAFWLFKNFWDLRLSTYISPFWSNDFFELQTPADIRATPRAKLKRAPYYSLFASGSSDSRKHLYVSWRAGIAKGPLPDDLFHKANLGLRYRFSDRFTLSIDYFRQHDQGQWGLAYNGPAPVFDRAGQPVLARRKYTEVSTVLSGSYNFTSRLNLMFRARHYWNKIVNTHLYYTLPDGYWNERFDMKPEAFNGNYNAFNLDVFCTWDFSPGSRVIVGWKNWLGHDYEYGVNGDKYESYSKNVDQMLTAPHGNEVTLRVIYFLDYQQLRRKRNIAPSDQK